MRRTLPGLHLGTLRVLQVTGHVTHEVLAVNVAENLLPERTGLLEVDCSRTKISIRKKRGKSGYIRSVISLRSA